MFILWRNSKKIKLMYYVKRRVPWSSFPFGSKGGSGTFLSCCVSAKLRVWDVAGGFRVCGVAGGFRPWVIALGPRPCRVAVELCLWLACGSGEGCFSGLGSGGGLPSSKLSTSPEAGSKHSGLNLMTLCPNLIMTSPSGSTSVTRPFFPSNWRYACNNNRMIWRCSWSA